MFVKSPRRVVRLGFTLGLAIATLAAAPAMASGPRVFTQTNAAAGNEIRAFERAADGALTPAGSVATGGQGLGGTLQSQGAVALSDGGRWLLAVNAGSSDVSAFRVGEDGLELVSRVASGGTRPVSVDVDGARAYVLNAGGTPSVAAFTIGADGTLTPIADGLRALADGASGAAQVSVAPAGDALVVTERTANRIETLPLDADGRPGIPVVTPSSGNVPFGFDFGHRGDLIVSEAAASTVSSYDLSGTALTLVSGSLPTRQGAACWVAVSPDGRFAYTGNAAGSISGFAIDQDGALTPLDEDGLTATSPRPNDLAFSVSGRYLYVINPGAGAISSYRVAGDGSLERLATDGVPTGSVGIAAR